jgi:AraC-like DNA-binding protein|nr:AraC family transcriptional regulator [Ruegeria sp. EL01]
MRTAYLSTAYLSLPTDLRVISVSPLAREVLVRLAEDKDGTLQQTLGDVLVHEIKQSNIEAFSLPLPANKHIALLAEDLRANPASKKTMTEWANELGLSERNLIRRVRGETGMTFREFRRQTRIIVAIERLIDGQPVTSVALDVGFETPSAFINAFRLVTGKTPRQFTNSS